MTLTLDEVVDLMLEGSAMTEPCGGSYYLPGGIVDHDFTCAIGAAAYAYSIKYLGHKLTDASVEEAVNVVLESLRDNNIYSGDVFRVNDGASRDEAIAFVKDKL